MISVVRRKLMTSEESFLTSAPITPRDVRRRYSNGRDLDVVFRNGYRKRGMCAAFVSVKSQDRRAVPTTQEETTSLCMRCHALKERERITNAV